MTDALPTPESFAYQAQTPEGLSVTGTIDATNAEHASRLLLALRLRVLQIEPAARPQRLKPLGTDDFLAFNQQLAHLTRAGLPIEHGLRLIAQDMRSGRLAETVQQLANELEKGTPLEQAFAKHSAQFPPLYSKLIGAGVTTSNLPAMLLNLGRHMEMVYRLRALMWRSLAYPLAVLVGLLAVLAFIGIWVMPRFEQLFSDFGIRLPVLTEMLLTTPRWMPILLWAVGIGVVALLVGWQIVKRTGHDRWVIDYLILPLPLIGPVLKRNLVARWCDAAKIAVMAGLDLPKAIELASDAVGSPRLRDDGLTLATALQSGKPLDDAIGRTELLPASVPAAMALASQNGNLPAALATLSEMYQQQAEVRMGLIPGLLTPLLVILIALIIGTVVLALFLPMISLIQNVAGPVK